MNESLSKTLDEIRKEAEDSGMRIFYGYLVDEGHVPAVHWNRENGGDWKKFFVCARTLSANILYVNSALFEEFEIDDAVSKLESEIAEDDDEERETQKLLRQVRAFQPKVGLTCVIDLAFVASGIVHIYQQTADWFDEFRDLTGDDEDDDDETEQRRPIDKAVVNNWATTLASDPKYPTTKQHEYLLEKIAGDEFSKLPVYEILRRAETIFQVDFKLAAEEKLTDEIQGLRSKGFNINAIALKLGISRERVSALMPVNPRKRET